MLDKDTVQQFVSAVAASELIPLSSEPQNGRLYSYGGILPGSVDPAVLELPRGVCWLNDAASSRLYVRPAYQVLLILAMAFVDHPDVPHHRVVITGSSGTGKTSFLCWVLRHLCRLEKPPVIVLTMAGFFGRIASSGEVTEGSRDSSFRQELASRATVYLCDATWTDDTAFIDPKIQARTIAMSPPTHSVTTQDPSDTMRTLVLVMPLWTMPELETCRSTCHSNSVTQETFLELYHLWGGVVKWTLGTPKQEAKHEFARSLGSLTFASVVPIMRNGGLVEVQESQPDDENDIDGDITIGSRVIHMHVDADSTFQLSGAAMCSASACSLLIGANSKQLQSAQAFVECSNGPIERRAMLPFYQQIQQDLFDRASSTP